MCPAECVLLYGLWPLQSHTHIHDHMVLCCHTKDQCQHFANQMVRDKTIVSKEIGSERIPKSTIAALGKMPKSEGKHDQTKQ